MKRQRKSFPLISEEMKQWSAMLSAELNSWPGFLFFYRRGATFAAIPRTRGFESPMPPQLVKQAHSDRRMEKSNKETSKSWFAFRLDPDADLRDALSWLNHVYEAVTKEPKKGTKERKR
jgi:hypothetical protein